MPEELLWKDTPEDKVGDFDYLIEVLDWEQNVDPDFAAHHFMRPAAGAARCRRWQAEGYVENWICYKSAGLQRQGADRAARARPSRSTTAAAYGLILMQGHGKMGVWDIETPALIRFGQLTHGRVLRQRGGRRAQGVTITQPVARPTRS